MCALEKSYNKIIITRKVVKYGCLLVNYFCSPKRKNKTDSKTYPAVLQNISSSKLSLSLCLSVCVYICVCVCVCVCFCVCVCVCVFSLFLCLCLSVSLYIAACKEYKRDQNCEVHFHTLL